MAARYVCIVVMEGEDASRADGDDCEAGTRTTLEAGRGREKWIKFLLSIKKQQQ